jgi:predicted metal-dependent phosphoesterase TrpH
VKVELPYSCTGRWYKGNIHCHSTRSDGGLPPEKVAEFYRTRGYDFLALTDHGVYSDQNVLGDDGILALPGEELSSPHMVALGVNRPIDDNLDFRGQIDAILRRGGLPILSHPVWMGLRVEEVARHSRLAGIEIYNFICEQLNGKGYSLNMWDELLGRGHRLWGFAVDDAHLSDAHPGGNAGWIVVRAPELSVEAILQSIRNGCFYSSTGPTIEAIELVGEASDQLQVRCSPCASIIFVGAAHYGKRFSAPDGQTITEATYEFHPRMKYCRVECRAADGTTAWSNPAFLA